MAQATKIIAASQAEQHPDTPEQTPDQAKSEPNSMNRGYWGYRDANEEDEDGGLSTCGGSCGG